MERHKDDLQRNTDQGAVPKLDLVLKCDSDGSVEAVTAGILKNAGQGVDINVIHSGVGHVNESDILLAETASGLIVGFQTDALPGMDNKLREHSVEVRLYDVIYKLTDDIRDIADSLVPAAEEEIITGSARIIALFKSCRKGIIIGCEVLDGHLSHGGRFRIISAAGPVYSGTIESMHIEKDPVQKAATGQRVGIKIRDFNKAKIGNLVESYRILPSKRAPAWRPKGVIIRPL